MIPSRVALRLLCALSLSACGARTGLLEREAGAPPMPVVECVTDEECSDQLFCNGIETCREGVCMLAAPVVCLDGNECTADRCDERTRRCVYEELTRDADGDGFKGPRAGFQAGAPGACGDDCNDQNRAVFPGAREVCNALDDNCNRVVDEGASFEPTGEDVRVSDTDLTQAWPGGLVWSGERYLATFSGTTADRKTRVYFSALDRQGMRVGMPLQRVLTPGPADSSGGASVWTGRELGVVWQDRRDGDFEVYFNRLTPEGEKLGPDQRLSLAPGFSINASLVFTGSEYVVSWQDERASVGRGAFEIFAQRIDAQGRQLEDNARLVGDGQANEGPVVAFGAGQLGLAWINSELGRPADSRTLRFQPFTPELRPRGAPVVVSRSDQSPVAPSVVWNNDRWVVAWHDDAQRSRDHEVWGVTLDPDGGPRGLVRPLSLDPGFSRYPYLLPLGNRVLLVWSDDRAAGAMGGYDLWAREFDAELAPRTPEVRVTSTPRDAVTPLPAPGPDGDVGILFRAQREGRWQVRFTRLRCALP